MKEGRARKQGDQKGKVRKNARHEKRGDEKRKGKKKKKEKEKAGHSQGSSTTGEVSQMTLRDML